MIRIGFSFLLVSIVIMGANAYAEAFKPYTAETKKILRFSDTKKEYGKSCEEYDYIPAYERLQLIKHKEFLLGDILADTLTIMPLEDDSIVDKNRTECWEQDSSISVYTYEEQITYLNDQVTTLEVLQYQYGAGAAHGNSYITFYIYDRDYGMRIDWNDLFGPDTKAFDIYVLTRVVKELADEEYVTYFKAIDQLLNFQLPGYFAITDEGLYIQYGKYEITPGASGLPSLLVPKKVLKGYMSEAMYRKCFGQGRLHKASE